MFIYPLERRGERLELLREAQHLLRRFGQLEILDLPAGAQTEFELRAEADRFIYAISGRCRVQLIDLRESSPTRGAHASELLDAAEPRGLLAPFGVACSLYAQQDTRLILLSTHSEPHPGDRLATPDELRKYAAIQ
jgi:redox-sensitive bicupin YhaK (pirin superfamily)